MEKNTEFISSYRLNDSLERYFVRYPEEREAWASILQVAHDIDLRDRDRFPGHLTASALVLHPDGQQGLLILHQKFGEWIQPGGHVEGQQSPLAGALREVEEETGLAGVDVIPMYEADEIVPWDMSIHRFPAHPASGQEAHMHYDCRYCFRVDSPDIPAVGPEGQPLRWAPIGELSLAGLRSLTDKLADAGVIGA